MKSLEHAPSNALVPVDARARSPENLLITIFNWIKLMFDHLPGKTDHFRKV